MAASRCCRLLKFSVSTVSGASVLEPETSAAVRLHSRLLFSDGPVLSPVMAPRNYEGGGFFTALE
jgi:hypothetical protein